MKAFILAAGKGTRLGSITQEIPKCLVEAGHKTMLDHVVERLKLLGVDEIVINVHHLPDKIISHARSAGWGVKVEFSLEPKLLDVGGGLKRVMPHFVNEPFFIVHNCDIYLEHDLSAALDEHRDTEPAATILVMERSSSRKLLFDEHFSLVGWENTATGERKMSRDCDNPRAYAYSGVHICSPRIFEWMKDEPEVFYLVDTWLKAAAVPGEIRGLAIDPAFWIDVGKPAELTRLRAHLAGEV